MKIRHLTLAVSLAVASSTLYAAEAAPAAKPADAAAKPAAAPAYPVAQPGAQQGTTGLVAAPAVAPEKRTAEEWAMYMADFTKNAEEFRDPRVFNAWLNAMTDASMVPALGNWMLEPGNWLYMMTTMMQPAAVTNYMQFLDPAVSARWAAASIDPMFYTKMAVNLSDPGKLMRWVMLPMDSKLWGMGLKMLNPDLYLRFMMMPTDPRGMSLMFAPMNPQLYGSMMGAMVNPNLFGTTWNTFMYPKQPVVSMQSPAPLELPISLIDPKTWGNVLNLIPGGVSLPGLTPPAGQQPAAAGQSSSAPFPLNLLPSVPSLPSLPTPAPSQGGALPAPMFLPPNAAATNPYLAYLNQGKPAAGQAAPALQAGSAAQAAPAAQAATKAAAPAAPFAIQAGVPAKLTLGADTLFKSGKSSIKELTPEGKKKLDEVVAQIKAFGAIESIKVIGHADKTGKAQANKQLSLARAKAVAAYLKSHGVKAASMTTAGMGDTKPMVDCDMKLPKDALKACLAPNRRVEIEVVGAKKA
jgi:outer membrane protein OmpA-like peptidoglycan-associated protein